jgi:hypothetical protein
VRPDAVTGRGGARDPCDGRSRASQPLTTNGLPVGGLPHRGQAWPRGRADFGFRARCPRRSRSRHGWELRCPGGEGAGQRWLAELVSRIPFGPGAIFTELQPRATTLPAGKATAPFTLRTSEMSQPVRQRGGIELRNDGSGPATQQPLENAYHDDSSSSALRTIGADGDIGLRPAAISFDPDQEKLSRPRPGREARPQSGPRDCVAHPLAARQPQSRCSRAAWRAPPGRRSAAPPERQTLSPPGRSRRASRAGRGGQNRRRFSGETFGGIVTKAVTSLFYGCRFLSSCAAACASRITAVRKGS